MDFIDHVPYKDVSLCYRITDEQQRKLKNNSQCFEKLVQLITHVSEGDSDTEKQRKLYARQESRMRWQKVPFQTPELEKILKDLVFKEYKTEL